MNTTKNPSDFNQLIPNDPQPTLVVSRKLQVLASNRAADTLIRDAELNRPEQLLPVNAAALVNSALDQGRAIEDVESRFADHIFLWSFIPDPDSGEVLVRGRDATNDILTLEEAVRSNRLYRLITENTTDLISRHAPDGRFIDATPASWRLLGYWPEELRGQGPGRGVPGGKRGRATGPDPPSPAGRRLRHHDS